MTRATEATLERIELAGGAAVAIVRASDGNRDGSTQCGVVLTLQGSNVRVLWSGRLDIHGDPGERGAGAIETADRTGDGAADVIVGEIREQVRICGQERTLLAPRAVEPRAMELRPVELRRVAAGDAVEITATATSPGPTAAPFVRALHFATASSSTSGGEDPDRVVAPRVLEDGRPDTVWSEGRGAAGRWEFVTARWEAGQWPIRAFGITVAPSEAGLASQLGRPRTLWIIGDSGPRLHVTLPEDLTRQPGARAWVVLPEPVRWGCVSFVIDEVVTPQGVAAGAVRTSIAEIEAYTELDFGGGMDRLVADLSEEGARAGEAERLLIALGAPARGAVAQAWPRMTSRGRRRAVRVLAPGAADDEPARAALTTAATDEDGEVRADAIRALEAAMPATVDALAAIARSNGPAVEAAALALARKADDGGVAIVLEVMAAQGGSERPTLREALRIGLERAGERGRAVALEQTATWGSEENRDRDAAAASVVLALSRSESGAALAAAIADRFASRGHAVGRFEDRWRLLRALATLPVSTDSRADAWLREVAARDETWMLRSAAIDTLAARRPASSDLETEALGRARLEDDYPRVRMAAIRALAARADAVEAIAALARQDDFPIVRAEAVEALARHDRAARIVRAAVTDPSMRVRAAAIRTLQARGDRGAWPLIDARLRDDGEWPVVIEAGIAFAKERCVPEARESLLEVIRRGMRPDAWAPDLDVAISALDALVAIGGEGAREGIRMASRETAPAGLRAAAQRARRVAPTCR